MRFTIIIAAIIMNITLLGALYAWGALASGAMSACQQTHSYATCVNTLR